MNIMKKKYRYNDMGLVNVRQELLDRGDEVVTFRQLVERFDEVEDVFEGDPWNLKQIYNNFNILIGEKPCKDTISRQAVLSMQYRIDDSTTLSTRDVVNVEDIENLPPVTPQKTDWTPVSEGLPKENGKYFVTVKQGYVTTAIWVGTAEFWSEVTAWMPYTLPSPYKAESEVKE